MTDVLLNVELEAPIFRNNEIDISDKEDILRTQKNKLENISLAELRS